MDKGLLKNREQAIDLGGGFRVEFPTAWLNPMHVLKNTSFHHQVFFNRQKPIESSLELQRRDCANR
jgi:hypothetical protein